MFINLLQHNRCQASTNNWFIIPMVNKQLIYIHIGIYFKLMNSIRVMTSWWSTIDVYMTNWDRQQHSGALTYYIIRFVIMALKWMPIFRYIRRNSNIMRLPASTIKFFFLHNIVPDMIVLTGSRQLDKIVFSRVNMNLK